MNQHAVIGLLEKNRNVFQWLLADTDIALQNWRPAENKWNLLEIVCHLLDEEVYDFRARVKHTLETPGKTMPSIDPTGWVLEKKYASRNFDETLALFLNERIESINYLRSLKKVNWQSAYHHPLLGEMSAENFLYNWLAHDYLHIRQINRYHFLYLKEKSGIDLSYAGDW